MVSNPNILLLDEVIAAGLLVGPDDGPQATSALDSQSEKIVQKALENLMVLAREEGASCNRCPGWKNGRRRSASSFYHPGRAATDLGS